jgi:DNA-dependent RNA polymerase auxiliary subunit epsilon
MSLKDKIIQHLGFDPDNEQECLEAIKDYPYNIVYISKPSEEVQLEAVKDDPESIRFIKNPSIEVQKAAIYSSRYNIEVIVLCPDWKEFEKEIEDNMMIKDIIE